MTTAQPTTFTELKDLLENGEVYKKPRTPGNAELYKAYVKYVPDNIKELILTAQQEYYQAKTGIYTSGWTQNFFFYDLPLENLPLVKHCNLWYEDWNWSDEQIEEETKKWIKALFQKDLEFYKMVNKPEHRSIKGKAHAHIFINLNPYFP